MVREMPLIAARSVIKLQRCDAILRALACVGERESFLILDSLPAE